MAKKTFSIFIGLLLILSFTSCPDIPEKEDDEKASGFTLSGDLIGGFNTNNPTNLVTIKLLPDNNPASAALYSTSTSTWRDTKAPWTERYASYSISGINAGTYYLYAEFNDTTDVSASTTDGPTSITITADMSQDIDFTI